MSTHARRVVAISTCHNRREQTIRCLASYFSQDTDGLELTAILVDDGSTDGTPTEVERLFPACTVVRADGSLFWARGMAIAESKAQESNPDFVLWLNDDVTLDASAVQQLIDVADSRHEVEYFVVAGAVRDPAGGNVTYGGVRRVDWHPLRYAIIAPSDAVQEADTVHGNVLLVPAGTMASIGGIDGAFAHAYADFDYGLRVRAAGGHALVAPHTVGVCSYNAAFEGRLRVPVGRWHRVRAINTTKGRPWASEVRYLRRHVGVTWPLFAIAPYVKTILGRRHTSEAVRSAGSESGGAVARPVAMVDGHVLPYRIPLYECLAHQLSPTPFLLLVDSASSEVVAAVESSGGRLQQVPAVRIARLWRHPQGFAEANSVVVWTRLLRVLSRERPTAVITSELGLRTLQALIYKLRHRSSRLLIWARLSEHSELGRGRTHLRRMIVRRADVVIVNGSSGRRYIEALGVPSRRIAVIPQVSALPAATHLEVQRRQGPDVAHFKLLFVGRLVELKGVDIAIRAVAGLPGRATLRIVGDGPERQHLETLAKDLYVDAEFVGEVHDVATLRDEFIAADYFVFPSLSDEWALVIVEAMSQGTPVIGSDYAQAVTELVRDGVSGFRALPDAPDGFSTALAAACAASSEQWKAMSEAAWQSAAQITPPIVADRFLSLARASSIRTSGTSPRI